MNGKIIAKKKKKTKMERTWKGMEEKKNKKWKDIFAKVKKCKNNKM